MTRVHASKAFQLHSSMSESQLQGLDAAAHVSPQMLQKPLRRCFPTLPAHLVRKPTVLVAGLHELAPDLVKALVVLLQQPPVRFPHLVSLPPQVRHHLGTDAEATVSMDSMSKAEELGPCFR